MPNPLSFPLLILALSFLVLWASARVGFRFGGIVEDIRDDFNVVLTATLTLLGLIVGFTFSMAISRYDQRKLYEAEEANTIGTAYIRTELLSASDGENVRRLLRDYLDQRILFYQTREPELLHQIDAATAELQTKLWMGVKSPSLAQPTPLMALVVSGMNDVLDSQGYAQAASRNRIPVSAWTLMGLIAIFGNLMIGLYLHRVRSARILLIVLPTIVSVSFFLIADIDSPRGGLIRILPENLISVVGSLRH